MAQTLALDMLTYADGIVATKYADTELRLAMLASSEYVADSLFPAELKVDQGGLVLPSDTQAGDPEDVIYDYSAVKWESPADSGIEEWERMQAAMNDNATVTVTDAESGVDPWRDIAQTDTEREWT
jgi:hypothetical protein